MPEKLRGDGWHRKVLRISFVSYDILFFIQSHLQIIVYSLLKLFINSDSFLQIFGVSFLTGPDLFLGLQILWIKGHQSKGRKSIYQDVPESWLDKYTCWHNQNTSSDSKVKSKLECTTPAFLTVFNRNHFTPTFSKIFIS